MSTPLNARDVLLQSTTPRFTSQAGQDGLNSATVFIYQSNDTGTPPALPSVSATYTFNPAGLTGLNNGWSFTPPAASAGKYRFFSRAVASATTATDVLASLDWSAAQILAQDGTNGRDGSTSLYPPLTDTGWAHSYGGSSIVAVADGPSGATSRRSTTAQQTGLRHDTFFTIDRSRTYRVRFFARASATANGLLYFDLHQYLADGVTPGPVNGGRSPYKPSAVAASTNRSWIAYDFLWATADWQAGVTQVRPDFLLNYIEGGATPAGYWEIQDFQMRDVTDAVNAQAAAEAVAAVDATAKANAAQAAAQAYALAKADLAAVTAAAYADGIVDAEEARAIADATAKANAAQAAAISTAAADATSKANTARTTAEAYALAKANLAETTAKAYSDGIVDAEETRAIADATAKAEAARIAAELAAAADATAKANAAVDITLVPRGAGTVQGTNIGRGGGTAGWNSDVYSKESYSNGSYASGVVAMLGTAYAFGLNDSPTASASFDEITFAFYVDGSSLYRSVNGALVGLGPLAVGDVLLVTHDGVTVRWYQNGVLLSSLGHVDATPLFFDSSFYSLNAKLNSARVGPMSSITGLANRNGDTLTNTTINNPTINSPVITGAPTFPAFALAALSLMNGSSSSNAARTFGSRTAVPTGGVGTITYSWAWTALDGHSGTVSLSGDATATVTVSGKSTDGTVTGRVTCTARDSNGLVAVQSFTVSQGFGAF